MSILIYVNIIKYDGTATKTNLNTAHCFFASLWEEIQDSKFKIDLIVTIQQNCKHY